jgi:hypothetical protein
MEHEREPLGRSERVEHHEQRQADRLGLQGLLLGVDLAGPAGCGLRDVLAERFLAVRGAGAEHVQAHPAHHGGEPSAEIAHGTGVGAAEPQPGFLKGVIGFAARPQHPVGHRRQAGPMLFEPLGQPVLVVHCYLPRSPSDMEMTKQSSPT